MFPVKEIVGEIGIFNLFLFVRFSLCLSGCVSFVTDCLRQMVRIHKLEIEIYEKLNALLFFAAYFMRIKELNSI